MGIVTSATDPTAAVTFLSTTSALGARVRSVHSPSAAKKRKWPVADVGTSAMNSPVASRSRTYAPATGCPARRIRPWITASLLTSIPSRLRPPVVAPHMCSSFRRRGRSELSGLVAHRYRHTDQRAVFGPGAVVVLHIVLVENLVQHEPRMRASLTDPAVGDDVVVPAQAGPAVELLEFLVGLEGTVVIRGLAPRHVDRRWDVSAALGLFLREVGRGEQPAGVLVGAADVHQASTAYGLDHFIPESPDIQVGFLGGVTGRGPGDLLGAELPGVELPLLAPAVEQ